MDALLDSIDISCLQNDRMLFVIQPVIPDLRCTVLVIPDWQCTVLVIPDSVPGSPSWLAKKNVGIGPIN
jgi:hypothetical protein